MSKNIMDYSELKKMESKYFRAAEFKAFLEYIAPKWYVECESTGQNGHVKKIIRNRFGIPVCLQVDSYDGKKDFISVDRVSFYEPWNNYISNYDEYDDLFFDGIGRGGDIK